MKKKLPLFITLLLATFVTAGCSLNDFFSPKKENEQQQEQTTPETPEDNPSGGGEEEPPVDGDPTELAKYYEGYNLNRTGGRLINELQKMCFDKHTTWITYSDLKNYYGKTTDADGNTIDSVDALQHNSTRNEFYYTAKSGTGLGSREHVWPCANSGTLWVHDNDNPGVHNVDLETTYVGGGSDLLHVRPCNSAVNTARGNSKFVSFDDPEFIDNKSETYEMGDGGKYTLKIFGYETTASGQIRYAQKAEPDDNFKGDIARLVLYVFIHYAERGATPSGTFKYGKSNQYTGNYNDLTGTLALTQIMGYDTDERCKEVLKAWNKLDAPSNVEKLRNDSVQKIQGNRNPFVDYPELVDKIFA